MRRSLTVTVMAVALAIALGLFGKGTASRALQATPTAAPVVIANEVLGRATPVSVDNPELALGRVTIAPGAAIPPHVHPGTQIAAITQGTLTYTVYTGEVAWYHGDDPAGQPDHIVAGQTVAVATGDALVETPGSIHRGRNDGTTPVVIYLSTLFPADSPRAILVEATPTP